MSYLGGGGVFGGSMQTYDISNASLANLMTNNATYVSNIFFGISLMKNSGSFGKRFQANCTAFWRQSCPREDRENTATTALFKNDLIDITKI